MNKLQRMKSTDLAVLRSILTDETDLNLVALPDVDHGEIPNKDVSSHGNDISAEHCENGNNKHIKNEKSSGSTKNFTPERPFIITRIESKHKTNLVNKMGNRQEALVNLYSSQNELSVYKSIHYQNIIEKEKRLERKYQELYKVLNGDVLMKTLSLCDQYINDGRQLVQNSLATSRIVSSFIDDMSNIQDRGLRSSANVALENVNLEDELVPDSVENPNKLIGSFLENSLYKTRESVSVPPGECKVKRTNHILDSEEPFIRQWLDRKNRQLSLERQIKVCFHGGGDIVPLTMFQI